MEILLPVLLAAAVSGAQYGRSKHRAKGVVGAIAVACAAIVIALISKAIVGVETNIIKSTTSVVFIACAGFAAGIVLSDMWQRHNKKLEPDA